MGKQFVRFTTNFQVVACTRLGLLKMLQLQPRLKFILKSNLIA